MRAIWLILTVFIPAFAAAEPVAVAREFLSAAQRHDGLKLHELADERIYIARVTDEEHIVIARVRSEIIPGFALHLKDTLILSDELAGDNSFVSGCAVVRQKKKTLHWLLSFEFRHDRVKTVLFQDAGGLCIPSRE